ncbi:MAG: cytochrome P450, partial [Myxococcota bacterium]
MSKLRADEHASLHYPGDAMHAWLHGLRARGPVVEVPFGGGPAWLVLGHDALTRAFKDEAAFPAGEHYKRALEPSQGRTFQGLDGHEHHVLRSLATPAFRPRALRSWEDELAPLAHELFDRFAGAGRVDLVDRFTRIYPFLVITRMLGIPRDREEAFHGWATAMLRFDAKANAEFTAVLRPLIALRRREPRDDVVSGLLQAEVEGRRMSDEEVLSHVRLLFSAGATTTFDALGNLWSVLLARPDVLERVRGEPDALDRAVEELLRWETPVANLPRLTLSGGELAGVHVPPKSTLLFSITGANRDPAVFPDPDRFDLDRDTGRKLTFGLGSHSCPGLHLARGELRVATRALLDRTADLRLLDAEAALPRGFVVRGPAPRP